MSRNKALILFSLLTGVALAFAVILTGQQCNKDGFDCISDALGVLQSGVILLPLIFGISGLASAKEKKIKQGLLWLGVSFAIILTITFTAGLIMRLSNMNTDSSATQEVTPAPKVY